MVSWTRRGLRKQSGVSRKAAKRRAAEELLRHARKLKPQLAALRRSAQGYHRFLALEVSSAEIELLATPEADLLGSLECLCNSDLEPVEKKLAEVEAHLAPTPPRQAGRRRLRRPAPRRPAKQ